VEARRRRARASAEDRDADARASKGYQTTDWYVSKRKLDPAVAAGQKKP
jgi:hypothetical protein